MLSSSARLTAAVVGLFVASTFIVACGSTHYQGLPGLGAQAPQPNKWQLAAGGQDATPAPSPTPTPYYCLVCVCNSNSMQTPRPGVTGGTLTSLSGIRHRFDATPTPVPNPTGSGSQCNGTPSPSSTPSIAAIEMAQAVQSLASPLPLVAGRAALLRVYVVSPTNNNTPPPISVQIGSGAPVTVTPPPAMGDILPAAAYESNLNESYNIPVPSGQVQPGVSVQASILNANNGTYGTANLTPTVVSAPALQVLVYAIRLSTQGNPANITGSLAQQVFFAPSVQFVQTNQVFNDSRNYSTFQGGAGGTDYGVVNDFNQWLTDHAVPIGGATKALGVYEIQESGDGESPGIAYLDSNSAIAFDGNNAPIVGGNTGANFPLAEAIAAHELGHALGLGHANLSGTCASPWGGTVPDPPILNTSGQINAFGYDLRGAQPVLMQNTVADYMSYCSVPTQPVWTSDLDWNYLATHQMAPASSVRRPALSVARNGNLLAGTLPATDEYTLRVAGSTVPVLEFVSAHTSSAPDANVTHASGTDIVQGFDVLGNLLFTSQPFGTVSVDDGVSNSDFFSIETQITAAQYVALHALKLTASGQSLTVTSKALGPPVAVAQNLGNGQVQIIWDANQYPDLYLQTSDGTGYALGLPAQRGSATIDTNDASLDIEFCDGVKSVFRTVHVLPVAVPSASVPISSPVPTLAPTSVPTPGASSVPTPSPSVPSLLPSSVVGQEMTNPAITADFWMPNASDLQAAPATSNDPNAWITRGVRLDTVLGANKQNSAWIELGDFAGNFGTGATTQPWNGHYYAWHSTDGTYGEMTAGTEFPTDWHEFNISADSPGWQVSVDNTGVGYIQDPTDAQVGARTDALIQTGSLAEGTFTSGTQVSYLQYMDLSGSYNFWPAAQAYNFAYPTATSSYDANSYAVTFSSTASTPTVGATAGTTATARLFKGRLAPVRKKLPDRYLLAENGNRRSEFLARGASALRNLSVGGSSFSVSSMRLEHLGDVSQLRGVHSKQIAPGRLVWAASLTCPRGVATHIGRFESGAQVLDLIDAATGRLLGFTVSGRLVHAK